MFGLITLIYALVGVIGAMVLSQTLFKGALGLPKTVRGPLFGACLTVTACFFLAPTPFIFIVTAGLCLVYFGRKMDRAILGVFLLPLLPAAQMQFLSLPGINYLFPLSFPILLSAILFLPASNVRQNDRLGGYGFVDAAFLTMIVGYLILDFRGESLTHEIRMNLVMLLTFAAPYLAVSRSINSREKLDLLVKCMLIALLIMAGVALIDQRFWWDIYSDQQARLFGGGSMLKVRGGLLRITSTFGNAYINVGILLVSGALLSLAFVVRTKNPITRYGMPALLLIGALMTASRSPFVAGLLSVPILLTAFPNVIAKVFRFVVIGAVAVGLISISPMGGTIAEFMPGAPKDEGEDTYRGRLMDVGMQEVRKRPILGDAGFRENPVFEQLRQGEGIIDFVNSYLEKALHYGVPMAILYIFISAGTGLLAWRAARRLPPGETEWRFLGAGLAGASTCFAVGLVGTSTNGQTEMIGYILAGVVVAYLRVTLATSAARSKSKPYTPHPGPAVAVRTL